MKHLQSMIARIALAMSLLVFLGGTSFAQGLLFTESTWGVEELGLQESATFERAWGQSNVQQLSLHRHPATGSDHGGP